MKKLIFIITMMILLSSCTSNKLLYTVCDKTPLNYGYSAVQFEPLDYGWIGLEYPNNVIIVPDSAYEIDQAVLVKRNGKIIPFLQ